MASSHRDLFTKTGVAPSQVGVLVVNCSLFSPTPSLAAHIMNHFKMASSVLSFNLGGMGCSGGGGWFIAAAAAAGAAAQCMSKP